AGVNITYQILDNAAVAMTGGQAVDGPLTVPQITRQVHAEGVHTIVVVTDEPSKYSGENGFAPGVDVRHRDELDAVQRELRDVAGISVLIYDQTCAAEKRRRRRRGRYPDPPRRVFITPDVCEGCGDCSEASNCVSVRPLETPFGRKRFIDQSACNKDYSCLKGFCPSFVTLEGARPRATDKAAAVPPALPDPPPLPLDAPYGILVTGIGGTGVLTVSGLLGMAAHLEGKACTLLDFTGMSQKNGAVSSHVRIARQLDDLHAVRIAVGGARLLLGCDLTVSAAPASLARIEQGITRVVVNGDVVPTAAFVLDTQLDLKGGAMQRAITEAAGADAVDIVDASRIAAALTGDAIAANVFLLGYAFQRGLIPLGAASLERALELNATAVAANEAAFAWGRLAALDLPAVERAAYGDARTDPPAPPSLPDLVEQRAQMLVDYQDAAYAARYRRSIARVAEADDRLSARSGLTEAAARSLHKLMAYKDEYEVARLYTAPAFRAQLAAQFDGDYRLTFHLAPPLLARRDPVTGHPRKRAYGPWMLKAFAWLARLKRLRGTRLDLFGRTEERRMERALIEEFERTLAMLASGLDEDNYGLAVEIASLPLRIRGFGHVKLAAAARVRAEMADLLDTYQENREGNRGATPTRRNQEDRQAWTPVQRT
ncbi:MAG: indolepyruvate ferredoxin oxidoreductase family protein, partial [Acidobacteria bacterium]|nr:indolepyruvate ferredoxin oxidoreductase family protein [Acidobacteriota bacterium]